MNIKVQIKNEILGDSVFWEGEAKDIGELESKNKVAHCLAKEVKRRGGYARSGMWLVSEVIDND